MLHPVYRVGNCETLCLNKPRRVGGKNLCCILSVPQFLSLYRKYLYINELMGVVTEFFQRSGKKLSILKVPTFEFGE
jgi:hypothetical protein